MNAVPSLALPARLQIDHLDDADVDAALTDDTLALIGFGANAPAHDDPRWLRVPLEPFGPAPRERWRGRGPVQRGRDGALSWSEDGALLFAAIELSEDESAIEGASEAVYRRLLACCQERGYPHLLRVWNYLDGITHGDGDAERYRRFCVGRARALGDVDPGTLPAATAIGFVGAGLDAPRRLQVYWLAAREPGTPLENPRQLSAYRYPRQYGPQPPSFARAMLPPSQADMPLLLSGTAAIVGHESRHIDSVATQLDETLANFDSLLAAAHAQRPQLAPRFGPRTRLKVYVREREELATVTQLLEQRLAPEVPRIVLHAAICRRELRVEIEGVHC